MESRVVMARSSRRGPRSPSAEPRMGLWGTTERDLPDQGSRRPRARTRYGCAYRTSHRRWAAKGGAVVIFWTTVATIFVVATLASVAFATFKAFGGGQTRHQH